RTLADDGGYGVDSAAPLVAVDEGRTLARMLEDAGGAENGEHGLVVEELVLRRERVDGWSDHARLGGGKPLGDVGGPGEDDGVGGVDPRAQERPRLVGPAIGRLRAHVTAPDHGDAARPQAGDEADRLGVVD